MSQPLYSCTLIKAAKGDDKAFKTLIARLRQPAFTYIPCEHDPRCEKPTDEQAAAFLTKLQKEDEPAFKKLFSMMA